MKYSLDDNQNPKTLQITQKESQFIKKKSLKNRIFHINDRRKNIQFKYKLNTIKSSKYNVFNFLPYALLKQFQRIANIYFLITAILQSIPLISSLESFSAIGPFVIVLLVSLFREMIEDLRKHKNDNITNGQLTNLYNNKRFFQTNWSQVRVGDFIEILKDEFIPADMIIIATSDQNGECYVETSNLDGERNLKTKSQVSKLNALISDSNYKILEGFVCCDKPNKKLNKFYGYCILDKDLKNRIPLNINNLLIRGTKLKNTSWVVGLVVYAGNDCKIIQIQEYLTFIFKSTHIENRMNHIIIAILIFQSFLCIIMAYQSFQFLKKTNNPNGKYHWYIYENQHLQSLIIEAVIGYFSFFLIFNTLVPISIIISLETLKWIQTVWIEFDQLMYSNKDNKQFGVLNSIIHEELGRVEYVFTDKTGTLTSNELVFRGCCIRGIQYTETDLEQILNKRLDSEESMIDYDEIQDFVAFWLCVTICHNVIVLNGVDFHGSSPDEVCLVEAAANMYNFKLVRRTDSQIFLQIEDSQKMEYEILARIEFTSERKRMSIVVRDMKTQRIILYCKGADNVILKLLEHSRHNPELQINLVKYSLKKFSMDGLRTLCFAYRYLEEDWFNKWNSRYITLENKLAKSTIQQNTIISQEMQQHESLLENHLILLGSTALEDRLQDKVPEVISDLYRAGIKVWMLTGDKLETAENIGYLCNMLDGKTKVFRVQSVDDIMEEFKNIIKNIDQHKNKKFSHKVQKQQILLKMQLNFLKSQSSINSSIRSISLKLSRNAQQSGLGIQSGVQSALEEFSQHRESVYSISQKSAVNEFMEQDNQSIAPPEYCNFAMILEGESINQIMMNDTNKKLLLQIILQCQSLIWCRCTPNQKAQVVSFVKQNIDTVVLAIGDGGNDVNMIRKADIGVGLVGKEGNTAAASGDYYISQFRYIWRLLFVHGRWNFVRTSYFVNFFFFKNVLFTLQQFYISFYSGYSAQSFWDNGYLLNYNSLLTAVAPIYYGAFDQDLSPETSEFINYALPQVYNSYKKMNLFGYWNFLKWFMAGVTFSLLIFFCTITINAYQISNQEGQVDGFWQLSAICYFSSVLAVYMVIIMDSHNFTPVTFLAYIVLSLLFLPAFMFSWDLVNDTSLENMVLDWLMSSKFYIVVIFNVFTLWVVKLFARRWQWLEYPSIIDKVNQAAQEWKAFNSQGSIYNINEECQSYPEIIISPPIDREDKEKITNQQEMQQKIDKGDIQDIQAIKSIQSIQDNEHNEHKEDNEEKEEKKSFSHSNSIFTFNVNQNQMRNIGQNLDESQVQDMELMKYSNYSAKFPQISQGDLDQIEEARPNAIKCSNIINVSKFHKKNQII